MVARMSRNVQLYILIALTSFAMLTALGMVFLYAPVDARMGVIQKIFYFHVPSAYSMYLSWAVCTFSSLVYLIRRTERADALARSAAEISLLFAAMVLITGPLWGRKSWGAYWTWDPRLTSTLLFATIIAAYVLLRGLGHGSGDSEKRFSAALALLGACVAPLIHLSVRRWRGQHPTVITSGGGGLDPAMWQTLMVCLAAFTMLMLSLLAVRYLLELGHRRLSRQQELMTAACPEEDYVS
jgi:heme exporter protein C